MAEQKDIKFLNTKLHEMQATGVGVVKSGWDDLDKLPGRDSKNYAEFRTALLNTPESKYQSVKDNPLGFEKQVSPQLLETLRKILGPMQFGRRLTEHLKEPFADADLETLKSFNEKIFNFLKLLIINKEKFQKIMENLANIDNRLYEKGRATDDPGIKQLIEALINLQANALLVMIRPEVVPITADMMKALVVDIKDKIRTVNELLGDENAKVDVPLPQVGGYDGSNVDRDYIKYLKYKAKYLKLKSQTI
jgi:hypothetical protein